MENYINHSVNEKQEMINDVDAVKFQPNLWLKLIKRFLTNMLGKHKLNYNLKQKVRNIKLI